MMCDFIPAPLPGGLLPALLLALAVALACWLAFRERGVRGGQAGQADRKDSLHILKARFASGDISPEQYRKMKQVLEES
jgi:uncharacterized membrane protein